MQISPDQLATRLKDGLKPIYVIHGEETLVKIEAADAVRAAARKGGYSEREHFVVDAHFDWSAVRQSCDNLSLFSTRRIVEITLSSGKPTVEATAFFANIAAQPPADTLFIINLPKLDKPADSAWFAACDRAGAIVAAPLVDRTQLPRWISSRLAVAGFDAPREVVDLMCERCEGNLLAAKQEIEKLALLVRPGALSLEAALDAVTAVARFDASELSEAFLRGDLARYGRVLAGLQAEGEQVVRLSWLIAEDVHALGSLILARRERIPMAQALRNVRVWGKRQKSMEIAVDKIEPRSVGTLLKTCATLDAQAKGQAAGDAWVTLAGMAALAHGALSA